MKDSVSYGLSFVLALAFHGFVVVLLLWNWQDTSAIEASPIEPFYIDANIVTENPVKAKAREQEEKKAADRDRKVVAKKEQDRQARLKQEAIDRARKKELEAALAAKKAAEKKVKPAEKPPEVAKKKEVPAESNDHEKLEEGLALAILAEQNMRRAVTEDEKAMAYVAQIQRDIIQNWSRPPSARNGMEAVLRVRLVPTGEVVDVMVEKSSRNDAFDLSALLAVRKAERFQVPDDVRQFEKNFREFTVLFRPEDLRL